ncbi:hypothetical protein CSV80_04815 [Sporosarcina sp. P12(2017)]|nr:hypothetical protein CSV81_05735 [Sporosarcina sp. P10]PIC61729.1 hypothetical protein CSV80_04815 [Sporosarcina sp. P12(2017)]
MRFLLYSPLSFSLSIYKKFRTETFDRKELRTWKKYEQDGEIELTEESFGKLNVRVTKLNSDQKSFQETIK